MPAKKRKKKKQISAESLRRKLKVKQIKSKVALAKKYPHVDEFFEARGIDAGKLRSHSAKVIGAGLVTGSLLVAPKIDIKHLPTPKDAIQEVKGSATINIKSSEILTGALKSVLPTSPRPLNRNEEKVIEQILVQVAGVSARATLEGEHLNTTYGYIGAEQHLRRFPGDTLSQHGKGDVIKEGMAPGLGAWGYFAPSKSKLTPILVENERWYAVVQTLYLPDWNTRTRYLREWYKYRKVLIVNTENGKAVVSSIADSGPAAWTGKHFGGSPEVMDYLGGPRYKKGPVILFFVDDPENKVVLGPVKYNE